MPEKATIDVGQVIDQAPLGGFQMQVMALCGLVALLDGFDAQAISFVASELAQELGVEIARFGAVFGSGTLGMAIGALTLPPICDRFGRRRMIIACVALFGLFSLATAWVDSLPALITLRLLTGIGVGAAVPCLIPLISEYSPRRIASSVITIVTCSWPLGAVLGGAVSAGIIPVWGWRSVFVLGGLGPLLLTVVLWFRLPESIRFLVARGKDPARVAAMLARISPGLQVSAADRFAHHDVSLEGLPIKHLFKDGRASTTLLLWIPFFIDFLVMFFIFNWLPPLLRQASLPLETAVLGAVLFNLGGIFGCLSLGALMSRFGQFLVVGWAYGIGAASVAAIGLFGGSVPLLMLAISLAGFCLVGAQACGNVLAANLYPTSIRATAVGWAYGVGRIGSIVGPVVGGILLSSGWQMDRLFLIVALPLPLACLAIFLLSRLTPRSPGGDWRGSVASDQAPLPWDRI